MWGTMLHEETSMTHRGLGSLMAVVLMGCAGTHYRHFRDNPNREPFQKTVMLGCDQVGEGWFKPTAGVEAMCRRYPNGVAAWVFREPTEADFEALWDNQRPKKLHLLGCLETLGVMLGSDRSIGSSFIAVPRGQKGDQASIVLNPMKYEYFRESVGWIGDCDLNDAEVAVLAKGVAGLEVSIPKGQLAGFAARAALVTDASPPKTFSQKLQRHAAYLKFLSAECPLVDLSLSAQVALDKLKASVPASELWTCAGSDAAEVASTLRKNSEAIAALAAHPAAIGLTEKSTPEEQVAAMDVLFKQASTGSQKQVVRMIMLPQLLDEVQKHLASIPPSRPWEYLALHRLLKEPWNTPLPPWASDAAAPLLPRFDVTWNRQAYWGMARVKAPLSSVPVEASRGPLIALTLGPLQTTSTTSMYNDWVYVPGEKAPPPPPEPPPSQEELQLYAELEKLERERQLQSSRLGYFDSADVGQRTVVKADGRFEVQYQGGGASAASTWVRMDAEWKLMEIENRKREIEFQLKRLRPPKTKPPPGPPPRGAHWEPRPKALVTNNTTRTMSIALPSGKTATHVFSYGAGSGPYDHPELTYKSELDQVLGRIYRQMVTDLALNAAVELAKTSPDDAAWLKNAVGHGPMPASGGWVARVDRLTFGVPP